MTGDCSEDTKLLRAMLAEAIQYMKSHRWCPEIAETYFGFGVGQVVAVFLFKSASKIQQKDDLLWVIVGDMPSAYLVIDAAPDAKGALETYCDLVGAWATAVIEGQSLDEEYPVSAPPTMDNAKLLQRKIRGLRIGIIRMMNGSKRSKT